MSPFGRGILQIESVDGEWYSGHENIFHVARHCRCLALFVWSIVSRRDEIMKAITPPKNHTLNYVTHWLVTNSPFRILAFTGAAGHLQPANKT
jgi:hypothetical protein